MATRDLLRRSAPVRVRVDPTEAQWRQAFHDLQKHDWPATLDELSTDTLRYRLVRLRAGLIARGFCRSTNPVQRPQVVRPEPPPDGLLQQDLRAVKPGGSRRPGPLPLDRKRLAAGERDDD
jgi:hypothetical protein